MLHTPTLPHSRILVGPLLLAVVGMLGCGDEASADTACRAGTPEPIFSEEDAFVVRHSFERSGQASRETVVAADDSLVIEQAGCDTLVQSFEFAVADSVDTWADFRGAAAKRLRAWSRRGAAYVTFEQYANAVEAVPPDFPTGRPADLAPGLTLRAYPLPTDAPRRWTLRLEQDLSGAQVSQ